MYNKTFTIIRLNGNPEITDEGIKYMCKELKYNRKIKKIILRDIPLTEKGLDYLSTLVNINKKIKYISINAGDSDRKYLNDYDMIKNRNPKDYKQLYLDIVEKIKILIPKDSEKKTNQN